MTQIVSDFMRIGTSLIFAVLILEVGYTVSRERFKFLRFVIDLCLIAGTICLIIGYILGCGIAISSGVMIIALAAMLVAGIIDLIELIGTLIKEFREK